jgi:hypothetical protein
VNFAYLLFFYYCGLLVFSLLGLVWLGHRRDMQRAERALERTQELITKYVRRKARRGY